jgi:hypothetical protein
MLLILVVLLVACSRGSATSAGPQVTIVAPEDGATVPTGQTLEISSIATDNSSPIQRIEMYINGDLIADDSTASTEGQATFEVVQRWVPIEAGEARVEVYAYNSENERSEPALLTLNVEGASLAPPSEPTSEPAATDEPVADEPGSDEPDSEATPEPTAEPEATATTEPVAGAEVEGQVTADIGLNVRSGPSVESERIGGVNPSEAVTGIARNEAGDWVKIRYGEGSEGWVAAEFVQWSGDIGTLPVE